MLLKKAELQEKERMQEFYRYVTEHTKNMSRNCRWIYGLHPSDELIEAYIRDGYLYYTEENETILGAAVITPRQDEEYRAGNWRVEAADDEVAVLHLLCIAPERQGSGTAKQLVRELMELAHKDSKKVVRLDALDTNKPAQRLYEGLGFYRCGVQNWYARNLGNAKFLLYEYPL